ncbi:MAG: glycosyltransferase family 2 protein [Candidatus Sumerlaeota bacterium]|nr:glycosyltransferase family 2 protein [Candidatus Sumerlaeota bacterium]
MPPLVSIILINWNQPQVTAECLRTLAKITYPNVEIVLVDNGSSDDSVRRLKDEFPKASLIEAGRNLGFTGGNNLGMNHAKGDYFLLLNNDTEVPPGFLEPLIEVCEGNPKIGAASPKIRFYSQPDTIQYAGGTPIHPVTGRGSFIGWGQKDSGQFDTARPTEFAHGAAFLVKRKVTEQVGVLFNDYFIYYEELDWSVRIRKAGYEIWCVPQSLVLHKESVTVGKANPRKTYLQTRNRILFMRRQSPAWASSIFMIYLVLIALPVTTARMLLAHKREHLQAYWKGVSEGLTFGRTGIEARLEPVA